MNMSSAASTNVSVNWDNDTALTGEDSGLVATQHVSAVALLFDLPNVLVVSLSGVVACISLLLNSCTFLFTLSISSRTLKPKVLLLNSMVTNGLLPLTVSTELVTYMAVAFGTRMDSYTLACISSLKAIFEPMVQYALVLSSLCLVVDRMYAIGAPFLYFSTRYSPKASILIVTAVWLISVGLTAPIFLPQFGSGGAEGICRQIQYSHNNWNNVVRFPIVIGLYIAIFVIYVGIFVVIKLKHETGRRSGPIYKANAQESTSLAVTFFAIHTSTLVLFLPGPFLAILMKSGLAKLSFSDLWLIRRLLIHTYTFNTLLNPCIMIYRIPSIRYKYFLAKNPPVDLSYISSGRVSD